MLEKDKKYTYEEIKEIFNSITTDVVLNPFGDSQAEANKELDIEDRFITMLVAIPVINTLKEKLFAKEVN